MKKNNNILFVVLTCDEYIKDRVFAIKKTWGKHVNVVYLSDTNIGDNVIGYDTPKNYDGIQEKYYQFFLNYNFSKYEYFFFLDDDTFVNLDNLYKLELPNFNELFCIGRELHLTEDGKDKWGNYTGYPMGKIKNKNTELPLIYPSGGSGFILSKNSVDKIQEYLKKVKENRPISGHSDVSIGFWLRACQIPFVSCNKFWWDTPDNLIHNKWERFDNNDDSITFHYVKPHLMFFYHQKYNKNYV